MSTKIELFVFSFLSIWPKHVSMVERNIKNIYWLKIVIMKAVENFIFAIN